VALVKGLARRGIEADRVISGSLRRQRDTAGPNVAVGGVGEAAGGVTVEVDARWDEYDDRDILANHAVVPAGLERHAGDRPLSSREFQQILNEALLDWIASGSSGPCREPWPQFLARVQAALGDVATALGKGQTALVVSSGGAIAALTASLLGLPPEATIAFNHVSINTGITKLAVGRGGTTLISSNEHAHLDEAGGSLGSSGSLITYR